MLSLIFSLPQMIVSQSLALPWVILALYAFSAVEWISVSLVLADRLLSHRYDYHGVHSGQREEGLVVV